MKYRIVLFCFSLLIVSCNIRSSKLKDSIDFSNNYVGQKSLSDVVKIEVSDFAIKNDTLWIVSGDKFLFYPFGIHSSIDELAVVYPFMKRKSLIINNTLLDNLFLKQNSIVTVLDTDNSGKIEIVYAKITDSTIILSNGIKIGLDKFEFMNYLPVSLQKSEWNTIHIVLLESDLLGIWNYYFFNNNKLDSVLFISDYQFDLSEIEQDNGTKR